MLSNKAKPRGVEQRVVEAVVMKHDREKWMARRAWVTERVDRRGATTSEMSLVLIASLLLQSVSRHRDLPHLARAFA